MTLKQLLTSLAALALGQLLAFAAEPPDYSAVHALWKEHCLDCHNPSDAEKGLIMDSYEALMKGGESGSSIVPGNSAESLLVKYLEGRSGKTGKNQFMPPGRAKKLEPSEIALVRAWIDAGAQPPRDALPMITELNVRAITPRVAPRRSIKALACSKAKEMIAVARYGDVELRSAGDGSLLRVLAGHRGSVNALAFSKDGSRLFAAGGLAGVAGEIREWNTITGELVRSTDAHRDAIYAIALSPDDTTMATGSYDQKIILWNTKDGTERRMLHGHNGCVFDLAFRPDGKILASASADRTVKLWDTVTGERRDTLTQPLKELYALAFSPDGKRLAAGGVDNRIRVWQISDEARETTNPLLYSRFGHEGAILKLAFSPDGKALASSADDRTLKIWEFQDMKERLLAVRQSDWAPGMVFTSHGTVLAVGRLDGTITLYEAANGKAVVTHQAPEKTTVSAK